jgi:hypothetical protein
VVAASLLSVEEEESHMCDEESGRSDIDRYAPKQWIYQNLTPWRIHACFCAEGTLLARDATDGDHKVVKVLSIPALGEVRVPNEDARLLNTLDMRRLGQIELRPAPSEFLSNLPRAIVIFGWMACGLVFGAWALFFGGASALPWAWIVAAVVIVPVVALLAATIREIHLYRRFDRYRKARCELVKKGGADRYSLEGVAPGGRVRTFVDGLPRQVAEFAVLTGAVIVSVIGLGVAIHLTTQLNDVLPIDYGELLRLRNPFEDVSELARNSPAFWQLLVGHIAQWVLVSVAALVPAAMYFQFDRQRLASIRRQWVQEVFRLDPTVRTVRDIEAKYGSQIDSSFGALDPDSGLRLGSGRRSPVIVATILLVVGWFIVISTTTVPKLVEVTTADGPRLVWPGDGSFPVSTFFWPHLSAVGYAFLGSYVFTLFHVLRGYQRRDLHPKTYNTVVVRILSAYALALVVSIVYDGPTAEVLLFFVGFMPQSALVWLKEKLSQDTGPWGAFPLREPAPLTDLEGIDLYDRTRLAEEGINNVEALAHADIVELMSSTRISAAQLVDWTDQAILYLRVGGQAGAQRRYEDKTGLFGRAREKTASEPSADASEPAASPEPVPDVRRNLCHLRSYGIRTASDLLQVYEEAIRRGGKDRNRKAAEVDALRAALELPDAPDRPPVRAIQTIIDTLQDEEWFVQVRNWREPEFGAVDAWYRYLDGCNWNLVQAEVPERVTRALCQFESIRMVDAPDTTCASTVSPGSSGLSLVTANGGSTGAAH